MQRRAFLRRASSLMGGTLALHASSHAQVPGERPAAAEGVSVVNPRNRVPVGLIIDDSTCLVNLNHFAVPQFAHVLGRLSPHAQLPWREWPREIPDSFVRKFGEWSA